MILIPVKDLGGAKQRLAAVLPQRERTLLAETMLEDVLTAVAGWRQRPPVSLVTSYAPAISLAARFGFGTIGDDENHSESAAIDMGTKVAMQRGARETVVLPADLPLVTSDELQAAYESAPEHGVLLVPSADLRGSNLVVRRPADIIPLRFGNDSFVPHRQAALATGRPVVVKEIAGIGLDIDTPADLASLLAAPLRSKTHALLSAWKLAERLADTQHA